MPAAPGPWLQRLQKQAAVIVADEEVGVRAVHHAGRQAEPFACSCVNAEPLACKALMIFFGALYSQAAAVAGEGQLTLL